MATFKFGRYIDIHWNGYDIQGPADTVFSIPDQLYEEFDADIAPVEPTLQWIDTNEFQTLSNSVSVTTLSATFPIALATSSTGKTISLSSSTNPNGYLLAADGSGGVIFTPASTSGLTSVVGVSPISTAISGGTVTVSINQASITGATAATNAETLRHYVKNTTGTTIAKGSAVYVSGATGDNALISLSTASTEVGSSKTLGITAESIATDAFGYVIEAGYLTGIDTSTTTAGASVWLGNTPGSLVFGAPPAEPSHSVYLGVVIREQQINGSILVKVQNGYELDELHDVSVASPSDGDIIQYKSSSDMWTKSSIAGAGIAASSHTHAYQPSGTYVNAVIGTSPASVSTASGTSTVSIVAGSINSTHLSANSVGASQIIDASIGSAELADNAVVASKIAAGAVGSAAIGANAVVAGDIAANAVTSGNIASGSVDTSKINSGSATNGQVLTANGSGGATFTTQISGATFSVYSNSHTVINGSIDTTKYNNYSNTVASFSSIAIDETNNTLYQISSNTVIRKIDLSTNSVLATLTLTLTNSRLVDIAFGNGKVCAVTAATAALGNHQYRIIDAAAFTVQNTGNILDASNYVFNDCYPTVFYESGLDKFTIHSSGTTVTTGVPTTGSYRAIFRVIDPSTYSTRVNRTSGSTGDILLWPALHAAAGAPHPVWISSASRWVSASGGQGVLRFFSDSGASTGFLTYTGSRSNGPSRYFNDIRVDPSSTASGLFITNNSQTNPGMTYAGLEYVSFSTISSGYNSDVGTSWSTTNVMSPGTTKSGGVQDFDVKLKNGRLIASIGYNVADITDFISSSTVRILGTFVTNTTSRITNPANSGATGGGAGCGTSQQIGYNSSNQQIYIVGSQYDRTGIGILWSTKAINGSISTYISVPTSTSTYLLGSEVQSVSGTYGGAISISQISGALMGSTSTGDLRIVTANTSTSTEYYPDLSGSNAIITSKFWSIRQ